MQKLIRREQSETGKSYTIFENDIGSTKGSLEGEFHDAMEQSIQVRNVGVWGSYRKYYRTSKKKVWLSIKENTYTYVVGKGEGRRGIRDSR